MFDITNVNTIEKISVKTFIRYSKENAFKKYFNCKLQYYNYIATHFTSLQFLNFFTEFTLIDKKNYLRIYMIIKCAYNILDSFYQATNKHNSKIHTKHKSTNKQNSVHFKCFGISLVKFLLLTFYYQKMTTIDESINCKITIRRRKIILKIHYIQHTLYKQQQQQL